MQETNNSSSVLTAKDIIYGHTYSAKKPRRMIDGTDNRYVVWISGDYTRVQYDSDTVRLGRNYPTVDMEKFLKWVKSDVTKEQKGDSV